MESTILNHFDFERLNILLEGFNQTTGFVTAILDLEGNVLSKSGWRQICTDFHRVNEDTARNCKTSDTQLASQMSKGEKYHVYKCLNGLVDVVVPVIIEGEHLANLYSGQFFFEEPEISFFKKQAKKHNFDETAYLKALKKVPVVSKDEVQDTMKFLLDIIQMITKLTLEKIEQQELNSLLETSYEEITAQYTELEETKRALDISRSRYILAFEGSNSGIFDQNFEEKIYYINAHWYNQYLEKPLEDTNDFSQLIGLVPTDYRKTYQELKEKIFNSNERIYDMEFFIQLKNSNEKLWILENGVITRDEQGKVTRVIGTHREITHLKKNIKRIENLKVYDQLTKLYNKSALELYLKKILEDKGNLPMAIILIDLDNFKYINDQYGHHIGDEILKTLANRMMQNNVADFISRFGGDEFVLVLNKVETIEAVIKQLYEINYFIEKKISIASEEYYIEASFGIALAPEHGSKSNELISKAELGMYHVKNARNNTWYQIYDENINENFENKIGRIQAIKAGIKNNEFYMVFQPVMDAISGDIYAVEALMRWKHQGEMISPNEFIPLAEEQGLIYELGVLSIVESIKYLKAVDSVFNVSINLSPLQLKDPKVIDLLEETIRKYGVPYERVIIEVTETVVIENFDETIKVLERMKSSGIRIAFDDFGTGYSSLSYLMKLPVDILKIDKEFVQSINENQENMALIRAIVTIANNRNLTVVVEGVETKEQLEFILRLGCRYIQGYYYFKPLSKKQLNEVIKSINK